MKGKTERESNLELLRIFSLLMIILHHLIYHCFYPQLTNQVHAEHIAKDLFTDPIFSKRLLIPEFIAPFGKIAVILFMMISGYFLISREGRINLRSISVKLIGQVLFAACFLTVLSSALYAFGSETQKQHLIPADISWFNSEWWFAGFYFLIVTAGALWLNKAVNRLSEEAYLTLILGLFALLSFQFSGTLFDNISPGLRVFLAGLLGYLWGGFCRRFDPLKRVRLWALFGLIVLLFAVIGISYYNGVMSHISSYYDSGTNSPYRQPAYLSAYPEYGIIPLSLSVLIFELFRRIRIGSNRIINFLAAASFMVYLIHDNPLVREYWCYADDWVGLLSNDPLLFTAKLAGRALLVYLMGVLVYLLYKGLLLALAKRSKEHKE